MLQNFFSRNLGFRPVLLSASLRLIHQVIDLRSDTVTLPTPGMRHAMANAEVGDDVYGEDPTINKLQSYCAQLFGKEAALFVPTGTMGNLICIMNHCHEMGSEVILGDKSHIHLYEQGGISTLGNVHPRTVFNKPDGTFDLDDLDMYIRSLEDPHEPHTKAIIVENTHNICCGAPLPLQFIADVSEFARRHNIQLHMDGARLLNAAVACKTSPAKILEGVDTVSVCLSKGLGCPVGSVIAGSKEFIARSVRLRKVLGGGMRQGGILAAAGLYALPDYEKRISKDHRHAKMLARAIKENGQGILAVNMELVKSNIVFADILPQSLSAAEFCKRMAEVAADEETTVGGCIRILLKPARMHKRTVRMYVSQGVQLDSIDKFSTKLKFLGSEIGTSKISLCCRMRN